MRNRSLLHNAFNHVMKVLPLIIVLSASLNVKAQDRLGECRRLWEQRRYADTVTRLLEYRTQTRDRSLEVDYMIATSFCRLPDTKDHGHELLRRISQRQGLSARNRDVLNEEISRCSSWVITKPQTLMLASILGRSGVKGKAGHYLDVEMEGNDSALNEPIEKLRDFTIEELRKRVFDKSQETAAVALVKSLAGVEFRVERIGRFVFATSSGQTTSELQAISANLEDYISFYQSQYGLTLPDKLVSIYLVPREHELADLARRAHGIRVGYDTIGYSVYEDLSIVGVIPRTIYGTLSHELFHLMVRQRFGDIPPWLEEGMASAYAVATRRGSQIYALPNWRGPVLKKNLARRLTIQRLVTADWSMFETERYHDRSEVEQKATAYALANYFVLYLQEQGKLHAVFKAFYDQDIANLTREGPLSDVGLLESVLGKSLNDVDRSFNSWFLTISRQKVSPY